MCGVERLESAAVQVRPVSKKVPAPGFVQTRPALLKSVYSAPSLTGNRAKRCHRCRRHSRSSEDDHDAPRPAPTVDAARQRVTSPVCGACARTGSAALPCIGVADAVSQHRRSNRASNSVASCRSMTKACLVCSSIPALFGALPSARRETAASGVPVCSQNTHACRQAGNMHSADSSLEQVKKGISTGGSASARTPSRRAICPPKPGLARRPLIASARDRTPKALEFRRRRRAAMPVLRRIRAAAGRRRAWLPGSPCRRHGRRPWRCGGR